MKQAELIPGFSGLFRPKCGCGCGGCLPTQMRGRPRRFIPGHGGYRKRWLRFTCKTCGKKCRKPARQYAPTKTRKTALLYCSHACRGAAEKGRAKPSRRRPNPSKDALRARARRLVPMIECELCHRKPPDVKLSRHHSDYKEPGDIVTVTCRSCHERKDKEDGTNIEHQTEPVVAPEDQF